MNNNPNPPWGNNPSGPPPQWQNQPGPGFPGAPQQGGAPGQPPQGPQAGAPWPSGQPQQYPGTPQQGWSNQQGQPYQGNPQQGWSNQQGQPYQGNPQQGWSNQQGQQQWAPAPGPMTQQGAKKKSRTTAIIAGALALALVVGGTVFAMNFLGGTAVAASQGVPANAFAVLEINLNPSVADKLAVKDFAEKFPSVAENAEDVDGDYKKALWQALVSDTDIMSDVPDYSEVEPWLGDSVAVAAMPGTTDSGAFEPQILVAIQVTDENKAKEFMTEHGDGAQIDFFEDLMVLTEEGSDRPDVSGLKDSSIADNDEYKADMAKLGGTWLATGWLGTEFLQEVITASGDPSMADLAMQEGHGAMGMKIEDGAAVIHAVSWSETPMTQASTASFIDSLPAGNLLSMGLAIDDAAYDMMWEQLQPLLDDPSTAEVFTDFGIETKEDIKAFLLLTTKR